MWQNSLIARLCNAALTVKIAQRDNIAQHKTYPSQADQPSAGQAGQPPEQTQPPARQSAQQQPQTPVGPVVQQPPVAQVYGPQQPRYLDMSASPPSRLPPNAYARVYDAESLPAHPPQRVNVTEKRPSTDSPESVIGPKMPQSPLRQPLQAGPQSKAISDVEQRLPVARVYGPQQPRYLDMSAAPPSRPSPNAYAGTYGAEFLLAHPPRRVNVTEEQPSTDPLEGAIGAIIPPSPLRQPLQAGPQSKAISDVEQRLPVARVYGPQQPRYLDMSAAPPSRRPSDAYARIADADALRRFTLPRGVNAIEERPSTDPLEVAIGAIPGRLPPDAYARIADADALRRFTLPRRVNATEEQPFTDPLEGAVGAIIPPSPLRPRPRRSGKVYTVSKARDVIGRCSWRQEGRFTYLYIDDKLVTNEETISDIISMYEFFDTLRGPPGPINIDGIQPLTFEQLLRYMNNLPIDIRLTSTIDAVFVKTPDSDPKTLIREYGAGGLLEAFFNASSYTWVTYNGRLYPLERVGNGFQLLTDSNAHRMIRVINSLPSDVARSLLLGPIYARDKYKVLAPYLTAAASRQINRAMAVGGPAGNQSLKYLSQVDYSYVRPNKLLFAQQCFMDMADGAAEYYSLKDIELIERGHKKPRPKDIELIKGGCEGCWSRFNKYVRDVKWATDPFTGLYVPVSGHFNIVDKHGNVIEIAVDDVVDVNKADAVHREKVLWLVSILNRLPGNVREFITSNPNDPDYVPVNIDNFRKKFLNAAKNKEAKYRSIVPDATKSWQYYLRISPESQAQAINEATNNFVSFCRLMPIDLAVKWYADVAVASNFYFSYEDGEWTASYPLSGVPDVEKNKKMTDMNSMRDDAKILIERAPWPVQRAMVMVAPAVRIAELHKSLARYADEQQRAAVESALHALNLVILGAALIKSLSTGGLSLSLVSPAAREAVKAGLRPAAMYAVGWLWRTFGLPAIIYGYSRDPETIMNAIHFLTGEDVKAPIRTAVTHLLAEPVEHRYHDIDEALEYMPR